MLDCRVRRAIHQEHQAEQEKIAPDPKHKSCQKRHSHSWILRRVAMAILGSCSTSGRWRCGVHEIDPRGSQLLDLVRLGQTWTLNRNAEGGASLVCDDGNGWQLHAKEIPFTDFPLPVMTLWYTNNVVLLPSEYSPDSKRNKRGDLCGSPLLSRAVIFCHSNTRPAS